MRPSRLGRGIASLIHEVPMEKEENRNEVKGGKPSTLFPGVLWPTEHPSSLTPTPLRLQVRKALDKLSSRPRHGIKAARAYLDHLRQLDARTHASIDLPPGIDLTGATMLQLKHGRITNSTRYQFFGVSLWK